MSTSHTPGRLRLFDTYVDPEIRDDNDKLVAVVLAEKANSARRLVACWNACEGIDTEHLENIDMLGETLAVRFAAFHASERELMDTRDKLLAAAQTTLAKNLHLADGDNCTLIDLKRAVERITGVEA